MPRIVSWPEFRALIERGVNFFQILNDLVQDQLSEYNSPKQVEGQLDNEPPSIWTIHADAEKGIYSISG